MNKGKDVYDIGKEDGRKERETEIIEVIDKCYELNILTPNQITEIIKQIKEKNNEI